MSVHTQSEHIVPVRWKRAIGSSIFLIGFLQATCVLGAQTNAIAQTDSPQVRASNSRYFSEYSEFMTINAVLNLPGNLGKKNITISHTIPVHATSGSGSPVSDSDYLGVQAANSDLVVIGRPISHHSATTADHSFLFTDYVFDIDQIEYDPSKSVKPGLHIVVARAGGILTEHGTTIQAIDPDFPPFIPNQRYVLFLHRLPTGNTFKVTANGSFLLNSESVSAARPSIGALGKNETEFFNNLREAIHKNTAK